MFEQEGGRDRAVGFLRLEHLLGSDSLRLRLLRFRAFLGLGDPALISWGKLIENAFKGDAVLNQAWWAIVPPGVCVTLVILACTMIGMAMEDALNPRLRVGHLSVRRFRLRPLKGALESE